MSSIITEMLVRARQDDVLRQSAERRLAAAARATRPQTRPTPDHFRGLRLFIGSLIHRRATPSRCGDVQAATGERDQPAVCDSGRVLTPAEASLPPHS
jgi:hypothetical protein